MYGLCCSSGDGLCISGYDFFFFKQKTAYEMRISDWSSDVCSSDLGVVQSNQSVGVRYEGEALQSSRTYYWKVRIWDAHGDDEVESDVKIGRASCRERVCQYV